LFGGKQGSKKSFQPTAGGDIIQATIGNNVFQVAVGKNMRYSKTAGRPKKRKPTARLSMPPGTMRRRTAG